MPDKQTSRLFASITTSLFLALATASPKAASAPSGFDQGVQLYNSRQYARALSQFQQAARVAPQDAATHYYMGLCYQCLNQVALATQQYQWVASTSRNPSLRSQSQAALAQLSHYQANRSYSGSGVTAASSQNASTRQPAPAAAGAQKPRASGRLKILEFWTSWCHVCKGFAPIWDSVSSQYKSRAEFQSLNAEDPGNSDLVAKYGVHAYPTIIYTDNSGKVLNRIEGAPSSENDFIKDINQYL